ncbi:MAG: hypothetical protein HUU10_04570 [Bacteroidetes bacterium]|nr:hypothetical protein [Bacteroidota bacterium]
MGADQESPSYRIKWADFQDWVKAHGCRIEAFSEPYAGVVDVIKDETGKRFTIYPPFEKLNAYTVYKACMRLGIPMPDCAKEQEKIQNIIDNHRNGEK